MATVDNQGVVTMQELIASSLAQTDALTKLLIEKGIITKEEFMVKLSMANENATDWTMDTAVAIETVRATEGFLVSQATNPIGIMREAITRFLGGVFNDGHVHRALSIIHAIDDKTVAERAEYQAILGKRV